MAAKLTRLAHKLAI